MQFSPLLFIFKPLFNQEWKTLEILNLIYKRVLAKIGTYLVTHTTKYISLHTQFTQNIYNQVTLQLDPLTYHLVTPTLLSIAYLVIDSIKWSILVPILVPTLGMHKRQ